MMTLQSVAHALGGEVISGAVSAPGPGHSPHDRSLRVFLDWQAPDGFRVHSHAGGDWRADRAHVRQRLGLIEAPPLTHPSSVPTSSRSIRDVSDRIERAGQLWQEAIPTLGTPVDPYLAGRRLTLPEACDALRYHPKCAFRLADGTNARLPAMVALLRDVRTNEPCGVHRTALKPDGSGKADLPGLGSPKKMLGRSKGAAIKLDPDETVLEGLRIGEGIETCLAARMFGFRPTWALGSANSIGKFPVLSGLYNLTLLEEDDKSGANACATAECGERWIAAGREVLTLKPLFGGDCNDALQRRQ